MAAHTIDTITPGAVGKWLIVLSATMTSTIDPANIALNGTPYIEFACGAQAHTFLVPCGTSQIVSHASLAFLVDIADEADTVEVTGETFQMSGAGVSVEGVIDGVRVGELEEETTEATRTTIKPGSKLHIYRQNDSR